MPAPLARRAPTRLLVVGLALAILTIAAPGVYMVREIRRLRDEQSAISDRNRLDSLQLLRIQNDLSSLAALMRDMADRIEPYPIPAWKPAFDRLRGDLAGAVTVERGLAPDRQAAQQHRLESAIETYWRGLDDVFARAGAGDDAGAIQALRGTGVARQREIEAMVSQFLVSNTHAQENAARANRDVYDRVALDVAVLVAALAALVALGGGWIVLQNRRAFAEAQELSAQLRSLSWHALNLQEDVQRSVSRELHDDFGQIVTAIGTLLGRARRHLADNAPLAAELESVRGVAQHALDRIRAQSQWFHPGVLDDYGLEKALERAVEQFQQQSGIETALTVTGSLDAVRPEFAIHIYRIVQEALNNVARHSGSAHADVRLTCANGSLDVDIADRGTGLLADAPRGLGFVTMRERAELMGGRLRVGEAAGGGGVAVHVTVPRIAEAVEIAGAPA